MDRWTKLSRKKLASLIRRDDFLEILAINNESVHLDFKGAGCYLTGLGKVTWIDKGKNVDQLFGR